MTPNCSFPSPPLTPKSQHASLNAWLTTANHMKLKLDKTELLFMPGKDCPQMDLLVTIEDIEVSPSPTARNLGMVQDDQLCCNANIAIALYNIHRIRPFLKPEAAQILVQAFVITCLDYCNSLLVELPASTIKPLQRIQKAAVRLVLNLSKFSHVTHLFHDLHWLPVIARIRFKTLVLAYKVSRTAPTYLQTLVRPHAQLERYAQQLRLDDCFHLH